MTEVVSEFLIPDLYVTSSSDLIFFLSFTILILVVISLVLHRFTYPLQHFVVENPHIISFPSFTPIQNNRLGCSFNVQVFRLDIQR